MGQSPEDIEDFAAVEPARRISPLRVLPGGAEAIPDEWYAAVVMLGALGLLWAIRRKMGQDAAHVHVGGTAAIVFLLYFIIVTGLLRISLDFFTDGGKRDNPFTRGVAFYNP